MKNDYNIRVLTDKDLGNTDFVRDLLYAWCFEIDPQLRPEFFGLGEPVRHSFAELGIDAAIGMWVKEGTGLLLRRRGESGYLATIDWWQRDKTLDTRPFPWSCNVHLRRKAGDELAVKYFQFLVKWFDPAFGYVSTNEQIDQKHFAYIEDSTGSVEQYVGLDIVETLPGIYWITYFGKPSLDRIGNTSLRSLPAAEIERIDSGFLVRAYPSSKEIGLESGRKTENEILLRMGERNFFDISTFDLTSLLLSEETEALIEKKIKETKTKDNR